MLSVQKANSMSVGDIGEQWQLNVINGFFKKDVALQIVEDPSRSDEDQRALRACRSFFCMLGGSASTW